MLVHNLFKGCQIVEGEEYMGRKDDPRIHRGTDVRVGKYGSAWHAQNNIFIYFIYYMSYK